MNDMSGGVQWQKPGGLPGFFERGRYNVENRSGWNYMELRGIVKARRRQSMNALQPYPAAGYMIYQSCIQTHSNKRFLLTRCVATQFG